MHTGRPRIGQVLLWVSQSLKMSPQMQELSLLPVFLALSGLSSNMSKILP